MPKTKLTVQGIKGLSVPKAGRADYHDIEVPGLILRVSPSGRKTFTVSYWKGGKRPRVTLGLTEDSPRKGPGATDPERISLAEARKRAKKVLQDVRIGVDPAAERREAREAVTFKQLAREYIARYAKVRKVAKSARAEENLVEKVLIGRWGDRPAGEIRKRDIVELLDEYEDRGAYTARNRTAALLSRIYTWGLDRDEPGLTGNPAARLQDPALEKPRKRILADEELRTLLPLFRREGGLAGLGFRLLALTGLRPMEVFEGAWHEVDTDGDGVWGIPKARTKLRRSRHAPEHHLIPLSSQARAVLAELHAFEDRSSGFMFPSPTRDGLAFTNYRDAYQRVRDAADLGEEWWIRDLRGTVLDGLKRICKTPGSVVSAIAGHAPVGTTAVHYTAYDLLGEKREALQAWGAASVGSARRCARPGDRRQGGGARAGDRACVAVSLSLPSCGA